MSPKRNTIYTPAYKYPSRSSSTKVKIPQPMDRPIKLTKQSAAQKSEMRYYAHWFTLHHRGIKRPWLGTDPLERRAVSRSQVRGTLPERIMFKELMRFGFMPGADFDFQSSQAGGRLELGGIVADFMFENLKLIIQVQGPYHERFLQASRDAEQKQTLADMGYDVADFDDWEIYNEGILQDKLRRLFGVARSTGRAYKAGMMPLEIEAVVYIPEAGGYMQEYAAIYNALSEVTIKAGDVATQQSILQQGVSSWLL